MALLVGQTKQMRFVLVRNRNVVVLYCSRSTVLEFGVVDEFSTLPFNLENVIWNILV